MVENYLLNYRSYVVLVYSTANNTVNKSLRAPSFNLLTILTFRDFLHSKIQNKKCSPKNLKKSSKI